MKLLPLLGFDEVRFGQQMARIVMAIGEPLETRRHPASPASDLSVSLRYGQLTLGFDNAEILNFIVVSGVGEQVELWDEYPFEIAARSSDAFEEIMNWLRRSGREVEPHQNCFGATISVPGQGVTFCFEGPDARLLEGIQLYPK